MEETTAPQFSTNTNRVGLIIVGLLAVAALGVLVYEKRPQTSPASQTTVVEESATSADTNGAVTDNSNAMQGAEESAYQDGEYTVMGEYTSPGGPEQIEVSLTLENGVVVDAEVVPQATLPISQQMQNAFTGGYEEFVIGKSIDEVELTKVAGSSLTPKGFNDAVEKIKQEALS